MKRKYHNTLLTTAAAIALIVSAGLASGQEPSKSQTPGAAPRATQSSPMGNHQTGTPSSAAQERPSGGGQPSTAQEQQPRGNTGAQQQPSAAQEQQRRNGISGRQQPSTAQQQPGRASPNAAQGRNGLNGLQGNASGTNVQLSAQQRTDLRRTVINGSGAPRVGSVDFDVTVGTVVPRDRIHVVPVPETLVRLEPRWRGLLYFVYQDDIIVVNPSDMRIVAVLPV